MLNTLKLAELKNASAELIEEAKQYGLDLFVTGKKTCKKTFVDFIESAKEAIEEAKKAALEIVPEDVVEATQSVIEVADVVFEVVALATVYGCQATWSALTSEKAIQFYLNCLVNLFYFICEVYDAMVRTIEFGRAVRVAVDSYRKQTESVVALEQKIAVVLVCVEQDVLTTVNVGKFVWQVDEALQIIYSSIGRYLNCYAWWTHRAMIQKYLG